MKRGFASSLSVLGVLLSACGVGEGIGEVKSEQLYLRNCYSGAFDLSPNFFAANPHGGSLLIRLQRGDLTEEASDGLSLVVHDLAKIRGDDGGAGLLNQDLRVGLPVGVRPPGVPIVYDPDPPRVSMSIYLNDSCDEQNVSVYSVSGTIRFTHLFSGDTKEENAEDRLTEASFDVIFAEPSKLVPGEEFDPSVASRVTGSFRFFFQRGQPAQPFP